MDVSTRLFLAQYQGIAAKLKKRILKKPNYREAADAYGTLSKSLDHNEWYQYAAICSEAMARCAQLMGNSPGEAESWADAARLFLKAESVYCKTKLPSYEGSVHAATHCFLLAIQAHKSGGNESLAGKCAVEAAEVLKTMDKFEDSQMFYERAADLQKEMLEARLHSLHEVANCKQASHNYDGALQTLTQIREEAESKLYVNRDLLQQVAVSQLLLVLILKPVAASKYRQVLDHYSIDTLVQNPPTGIIKNEELFILLQSLVLSAQAKDLHAVASLKQELWPLLSATQKSLYEVLVKVIRNGGRM